MALVRIEQLYPLPEEQLEKIKKKYSKADFYWVQEEPENMGAYRFICHRLSDWDLTAVSREASASPATGFKTIHDEQQEDLVEKAFDGVGKG